MKKLKKLLSIVLAVAMVMSLAVSVGADEPTYSITIDKTESGTVYNAYQIFGAIYENGGYTYTISTNSQFLTFIQKYSNLNTTESKPETEYFTLTLVEVTSGTDYYIVVPTNDFDGNTDAAAFAALLKAEIESGSYRANKTVTADDTTVVIDVNSTGAGYYFVDTSLGSLAFLDTVSDENGQSTIQIDEKNGIPTATKEVYADEGEQTSTGTWASSSNAQIGETVYFHTTVGNLDKATSLVLHDLMEAGLTFDGLPDIVSVVFYPNSSDTGTTLTTTASSYGSKYELETNEVYYVIDTSAYTWNVTDYYTCTDGTCTLDTTGNGSSDFADNTTYYIKGTFDMVFTLGTDLTVSEDSYIVVTYKATLNENAEIYSNSNDNSTYVSYGDSSYSTPSVTSTYTYKMTIYKYTGTLDNDDSEIEGVGFKLYYYDASDTSKTAPIYVVSNTGSSPNYTVTGTTKTVGDATEFKTDTNGSIVISGLDSDKEYYLTETTTVNGYNPLTEDIKITIDSTNGEFSYSGKTDQEKVNVQNNKGEELPATGGIGVTIFYVVGGILVLAAAGVIVITKRKAKAEK